MAPAALIMYALLGFWIIGGSVWLLRNRQYRLAQTGQFLMDLLGFPVELAQSIWGRGGVPYALAFTTRFGLSSSKSRSCASSP